MPDRFGPLLSKSAGPVLYLGRGKVCISVVSALLTSTANHLLHLQVSAQ